MNWQKHSKKIEKKYKIHSKRWRMENLYPIKSKSGEIIPLKFNEHQKKLIKLVGQGIEPTVLKSRQVGITTLWCIFFLDEVIWEQGVHAVIQAHKKENVESIFRTISFAFENMNPAFRPDSPFGRGTSFSKKEIYIKENNSRIETKLEVRSTSVTHVLFSEYGFTDVDRIAATVGSLPPEKEAFVVIESSPNGLNHFYKKYLADKEKGLSFFIPWFEEKTYKLSEKKTLEGNLSEKEEQLIADHGLSVQQINFRRKKISDMGSLKFKQEYPEDDTECFLFSGSSVIDTSILLKMKAEADKVIKSYRRDNLKFSIYKDLSKIETEVFVGLDSSEGTATGDNSSIVFLTKNENSGVSVVAHIYGKEPPIYLARSVKKFITENFKIEPMIVPERNNHGHAIIQAFLHDEKAKHDNLYHDLRDNKHGFLTTSISRREIFEDLFNAIYSNDIKINDDIIFSELMTLTLNPAGKIEAEQSCHDDAVIALGLALRGFYSYYSVHGNKNLEDPVLIF